MLQNMELGGMFAEYRIRWYVAEYGIRGYVSWIWNKVVCLLNMEYGGMLNMEYGGM